MTYFHYPTAQEYSYDGSKLYNNPNTHISFFSDKSLNKEINQIKQFNQTRLSFAKKYQDNINNIKHYHPHPKYRLIKQAKASNNFQESLPGLAENDNHKEQGEMSSFDISRDAIQQFKTYVDKETETSWYSPPRKEKIVTKEKESKLYQKIFKNKKEKQEMILKAFKRSRGITNTSESRELPIEKNKYSKMTHDTIKYLNEKVVFLRGVINYVFPKYLHYKIEPYMTSNYFYKPKLPPKTPPTLYSKTFYTNTTTKAKSISMLKKQYFPFKSNKIKGLNYDKLVQLTY